MALHAREFFAELKLPFADSAVVGDIYYAAPRPGGPLRLRIDFTSTRWANQYEGLRLATVHQDRGDLDVTILRFAEDQTFHHRDSARGVPPHQSDYGTIKEPWKGAHTDGLRKAIEQYTSIWFPGTWTASTQKRTADRTARVAPAPPSRPQRPSHPLTTTTLEPPTRTPSPPMPPDSATPAAVPTASDSPTGAPKPAPTQRRGCSQAPASWSSAAPAPPSPRGDAPRATAAHNTAEH